MPKKKQQKSLVRIENSAEFQKLVNDSMAEMEQMTNLAIKSGLEPQKAREKVASIYLHNLQQSDDIVGLAKKNVAELMTRIQLDRAINPEEELVSKKYVQLFKLQNDALKLISSMEPRQVNHKVQVDDDKMVFDVEEGVYQEVDKDAE